MLSEEMSRYWLYFCLLSQQLDETRKYVEHGPISYLDMKTNERKQMNNGNVCSAVFSELIISAAVEFESIAKQICLKSIDGITQMDLPNMIHITEKFTQRFPNVGKTKILTPYGDIYPLANWKVEKSETGKRIAGLSWWKGYTDLKHNRFSNFINATLNNTVSALSSLLILELYLCEIMDGNLESIMDFQCSYFNYPYGPEFMAGRARFLLPDFN